MITCQEVMQELFDSFEEIYEEQYKNYVDGECFSQMFNELHGVDKD